MEQCYKVVIHPSYTLEITNPIQICDESWHFYCFSRESGLTLVTSQQLGVIGTEKDAVSMVTLWIVICWLIIRHLTSLVKILFNRSTSMLITRGESYLISKGGLAVDEAKTLHQHGLAHDLSGEVAVKRLQLKKFLADARSLLEDFVEFYAETRKTKGAESFECNWNATKFFFFFCWSNCSSKKALLLTAVKACR